MLWSIGEDKRVYCAFIWPFSWGVLISTLLASHIAIVINIIHITIMFTINFIIITLMRPAGAFCGVLRAFYGCRVGKWISRSEPLGCARYLIHVKVTVPSCQMILLVLSKESGNMILIRLYSFLPY